MASHPITLRPQSGHPLRRALGPSIAKTTARASDDGDMKLFVVSFTAFFVCFYTFLL